MGWRQKLKCGDEWDWCTSWRRVFRWRAGTGRRIKRRLHKRERQEARRQAMKRG